MSSQLLCKVCGSILSFRDEQGFLLCTTCFTQSQDFVPDEQEALQASQGGHARAQRQRLHDENARESGPLAPNDSSTPIPFDVYVHGWCCLLQMVAAAADAELQLGSLVQSSCHGHARALVALLCQQAHDNYSTLQLAPSAWSSVLPVDRILHVMVCALSSLRCAVTCGDALSLAARNCFPYVTGHMSLPSSVHRSLSRHDSPLRPRVMPSAASITAGAAQLAALLRIEPPSCPLSPLLLRYAHYLQLPDICLAAALSLSVILTSGHRVPAAAASLLLLAVALIYATSPDAPQLLPGTQQQPPLPPLADLVTSAAGALDARAPPPTLDPSAPEKCTHSPAAVAAAAVSCNQLLQACLTADDSDPLIFAAGGGGKASGGLLTSPANAHVQPLPVSVLLELIQQRGQVVFASRSRGRSCTAYKAQQHLLRLSALLAAASHENQRKIISVARDMNRAALKLTG